MRITQESDYAFRICSNLARNEGHVVGAPRIAKEEGVSERFTLRILRKLTLAGITESRRGVMGGYLLKKPKENISLYDVLLAIEGPVVVNRCLCDEEDAFCSKNQGAQQRSACKFHRKFATMQSEIIKMFKESTIDEYV